MLKNFSKGLLFGALVGGTSGLLLAPRSGKDTRHKMKNELEEMTELTLEINDGINHLKDAVVATVATTQTVLPSFSEDLQKTLRSYQFQAEPRLAQINEQVATLKSHLPANQTKSQKFHLTRPTKQA
ncbi:gas vesicle protein [Enterococcus sp. PF1-24]|uniref:YtxH domain-containing protein n=1 Tax=unclassified Enterococcus TaxID=2608891 RepID=UPI002475D01A|nr:MULTISPECIES: YtxH domain-containing protein [unclassified Enterococcus]MDH6365565.1 gas vesicle protein [Enterococcus sp. PFB1-1]MDH6402645.1 gas vesicle protein [Enterococcus sp. PF1-24]